MSADNRPSEFAALFSDGLLCRQPCVGRLKTAGVAWVETQHYLNTLKHKILLGYARVSLS
ncbi:hypothetical protein L4G92_03920 [Neisseria sp. ZJ106]|uniref:hypothetical protein n=1 Tax=Neisseria lisongii TaxID=2912188 RepID=UPI001F3FE09F|nr:hypothetical protein [Neisseria lisongii]MCF7521200.1 hypothetical protein [Neisseria lisongii]